MRFDDDEDDGAGVDLPPPEAGLDEEPAAEPLLPAAPTSPAGSPRPGAMPRPRPSAKKPTKKSGGVDDEDWSDVLHYLTAGGLKSFAPLLQKARIGSMLELRGHTISELEESLQRKERGFVFSMKEKKGFVLLGLKDDSGAPDKRASSAPPKPTALPEAAAQAIRDAFAGSVADADLDRLGTLLGSTGTAPEVNVPSGAPPRALDLLKGVPLAAQLLMKCSEAELTLSNLLKLVRIVASVTEIVGHDAIGELVTDAESAIDMLEPALVAGIQRDFWTEHELQCDEPGPEFKR
jgi:hypothetical protein